MKSGLSVGSTGGRELRQIVADVAGLAEPANAAASKAAVPQGLESSTLSPCTTARTQNLASNVPASGSDAKPTYLKRLSFWSLFLYIAIRMRMLFRMWQNFVADQSLRVPQLMSETNQQEAE
jgi:hypothetical protein